MSIFLQEDFFVTLHGILTQLEEVTELQPVPDAHVPLMKFKFHGMAIDLLYASVSLAVIPPVSCILCNICACSQIFLLHLSSIIVMHSEYAIHLRYCF